MMIGTFWVCDMLGERTYYVGSLASVRTAVRMFAFNGKRYLWLRNKRAPLDVSQ